MKGFDILKVKSAVKNHNKFDLSRTHLTTMNFGEIVPLMVEETVPGDKFNVGAEYFSRMAPMVVPTYGKFDFRTVAAFVPYHQVAADSDAWFAGKKVWEGATPVQRYFTFKTLVDFYYQCSETATSANTDYTYIGSNGSRAYRKWTTKGKYFVKILNSLGYAVPQGVDLSSNSTWSSTIGVQKLSALPLLAFFKLYNDYMSQSQRFNTSQLSSILQNIKYNKSFSNYSTTGEISMSVIQNMFNNLFLNYDNDYFTSAWQTPNNPISNIENVDIVAVPSDSNNPTVEEDINNTYVRSLVKTGQGYDWTALSQRALDFLKSFDDWVRRNNYSGSRAVQQVYSRFGIKTDDYRSHYANVIATDKLPVQVGDITSTADAGNAVLGDYAGKGIMSGSKGFDISVSDYGLLIVLGYFTVTPMNPYGFDRRALKNQPLDYYNPEFDSLGAQAISVSEYFENPADTSATTASNAVFGYTERYNEYRYGRDMITGEFRKIGSEMNAWHTGRDLSAIRDSGNLVAQSTSVNTLPQSDSEYNRIFSITSGADDKFYLTARFNVSAVRPMLNLNQVTNLGEGDTVVPRNGNVIS